MNLSQCNENDSDKGMHGYLDLYEHHLDPSAIHKLTEIGVHEGASLLMWARWLPTARIVGIDIKKWSSENPRITTYKADATQVKPFPTDVLIDDGSHHGDEQINVFDRFWPFITHGGWYVCEDLDTLWRSDYRQGTEMLAHLRHLFTLALKVGSDVAELHAYEQIVFVRKA